MLGDKSRLEQVVQNLISNSLKYRKKEIPPEVVVSVGESDDGWVVSVSDNGIGIKKEFFEKIFQVFQRLHAPDEFPGTGIGLAICKKIVYLHGGRIWLESEFEVGTKISFFIPKSIDGGADE